MFFILKSQPQVDKKSNIYRVITNTSFAGLQVIKDIQSTAGII
jgi:hypothetical protein